MTLHDDSPSRVPRPASCSTSEHGGVNFTHLRLNTLSHLHDFIIGTRVIFFSLFGQLNNKIVKTKLVSVQFKKNLKSLV